MRQRLLLFAMMLATTIVAVGQGVTMRFTVRTANGAWHPFDSVRIENLTHGWNVTTPDSVVTFGSSTQSIGQSAYVAECELKVYPNPFAGQTEALLEHLTGGTVSIRVRRLDGTVIVGRDEKLASGVYRIGITLSQPQVALLCVESGGQRRVTKLVSCAGGGSDRLAVDWLTSVVNRGSATKDGDDFAIGDQVRCTAISYSSGARTESEPTTLYLAAENDITLVFSDGSTGGGETVSGGFDENGASYAVFKVFNNRTVHFSKGNLQFTTTGTHATVDGGTATGTWRFAEHQYDCIGADNANISSTYTGWIDLFCWATSGWNSGARAYQPWSTETLYTAYYPGFDGDYDHHLTGGYAYADWGVYNAISNGGNQAGMWRTLAKNEWDYLLSTRNASTVSGVANARYARATIGSVTGLIIFPDSFTMPTGISVAASSINSSSAEYADNTYTTEQWSQLESNGAVFLPTAGYRSGTVVRSGAGGWYWSSSYKDAHYAWGMCGTGMTDYCSRGEGISVRLVHD